MGAFILMKNILEKYINNVEHWKKLNYKTYEIKSNYKELKKNYKDVVIANNVRIISFFYALLFIPIMTFTKEIYLASEYLGTGMALFSCVYFSIFSAYLSKAKGVTFVKVLFYFGSVFTISYFLGIEITFVLKFFLSGSVLIFLFLSLVFYSDCSDVKYLWSRKKKRMSKIKSIVKQYNNHKIELNKSEKTNDELIDNILNNKDILKHVLDTYHNSESFALNGKKHDVKILEPILKKMRKNKGKQEDIDLEIFNEKFETFKIENN